jgi:hypothetical protein
MLTVLYLAYRAHRRHARLVQAQQNHMHQIPAETMVRFNSEVVIFEAGKD